MRSRRERPSAPALALLVLLLAPLPLSAAEPAPAASAPNVVALGHGLDLGLLGMRYARRMADGLLSAGAGLGLTGIAPKIAVHPLELGTWNLHLAAGALYAPWGSPLFSQGALLGFAMVGVQRWAYRAEGFGLFVHGAAGFANQFRGQAEGGRVKFEPTLELQVGFSF
jgi:hypothetical protein